MSYPGENIRAIPFPMCLESVQLRIYYTITLQRLINSSPAFQLPCVHPVLLFEFIPNSTDFDFVRGKIVNHPMYQDVIQSAKNQSIAQKIFVDFGANGKRVRSSPVLFFNYWRFPSIWSESKWDLIWGKSFWTGGSERTYWQLILYLVKH
jgi:hypothetical protein